MEDSTVEKKKLFFKSIMEKTINVSYGPENPI